MATAYLGDNVEQAKGVKERLRYTVDKLREEVKQDYGSSDVATVLNSAIDALDEVAKAYPADGEADEETRKVAQTVRNANPFASSEKILQTTGQLVAELRGELHGKIGDVHKALSAATALLQEMRTPGDPVSDIHERVFHQSTLRALMAQPEPQNTLAALVDKRGIDDPLVREAASFEGRAIINEMHPDVDVSAALLAQTGDAAKASKATYDGRETRPSDVHRLASVMAAFGQLDQAAYPANQTTVTGVALRAAGVRDQSEPLRPTSVSGVSGVTWLDEE